MVCQHDVKKMLLKQARMVYWKKWTAKHEHDELRKGVWQEPIQAMQQRKVNDVWTDKHRNVMRLLVMESGWLQKRLYTTLVGRTQK